MSAGSSPRAIARSTISPVSRSRSAQNACVTSATDGDVAAAATSVFVIALPTSEPMLAATPRAERGEIAAQRAGVGHLHELHAPLPRRVGDEVGLGRPAPVDGGLVHAGPPGHGLEGQLLVAHLGQEVGRRPEHRGAGAGAAAAGALVRRASSGRLSQRQLHLSSGSCILAITTSVALVTDRPEEDPCECSRRPIDIDATPDEVWEVLTDFDDYGDWNPFITSITGPAEPGARLAVALAPPGGRAITMKPTVRAAEREPPVRLARPPGRAGDLRRRPRVPDRAGRRRHDGVHPTRDVPRRARAVRRAACSGRPKPASS